MEKKFVDGLVSVIIPVYNSELFLEDTLMSVLNQTYSNIEIICVDDKSTDGSSEIINRLSNKYEMIKVIYLEKNSGVSVARNIGIKNARGRYIAFLDSDDQWLTDKTEKQIDFMQKNNYAFTFTSYRFMDENGNLLNNRVKAQKDVTYNQMLIHNRIPCLTVVIDRYRIDEIVMPKIRHEDYATWLSIMKKGIDAHGLDIELALYRSRGNSLSGNKLKAAGWTWNILRNVENVNIIKACIYFTMYAFFNIFKHFIKK